MAWPCKACGASRADFAAHQSQAYGMLELVGTGGALGVIYAVYIRCHMK